MSHQGRLRSKVDIKESLSYFSCTFCCFEKANKNLNWFDDLNVNLHADRLRQHILFWIW